jgi:hypothetical protein
MTGGSKIRSGGGLTAPVAFSREMNTSGTGVVGIGVTFGVTPLVFSRDRRAGGTGVAGTLVTFGTFPGWISAPGVAFSRVSAKTTPGSTSMMMHTVAMKSRTPEGVSRTVRMEEPFVCSINIVIIALKYECFAIHAGEREMEKSRIIPRICSGFLDTGDLFTRKRLFLLEKLP